MIRIVLFDVDGTLVRAGGAGRRAFVLALKDVLGGKADDTGIDFAGRTDLAIMRGLLELHGISDPEGRLRRQVLDRYLHHLDAELARGNSFQLCPGIPELLASLQKDPEFLLGLLTGNVEPAARRKLAHLGIDAAFRFGAYGSDDEDRDQLVPVARRRAILLAGRAAEDAAIVIVGDTPHDVRCARAGGAAVLAVATGIFDAPTLARCQPDALLHDLSRTAEVLTVLRRLSDPHHPPGDATPRTGG